MKLDELEKRELIQIFAELRTAQGQALGILTQAICRQIDPKRLKIDLQAGIDAAKSIPGMSRFAVEMATHAMAAAQAEQMIQSKPASEGPHPKRGA